MKRVLMLLCLAFMLTSCEDKTSKAYSDEISKITEKTMLERGNISNDETIEEEEKITESEEEVIVSTKPVIKNEVDKNEIDKDHQDYKIHKGKIDCLNIDECIDKSKDIQKELSNNIGSITYIDVKNKNNDTLGYFINYIFKDYQYDDYETCISKGEYLKNYLIDRKVSYKCDDSLLKITIDKEGDSN